MNIDHGHADQPLCMPYFVERNLAARLVILG